MSFHLKCKCGAVCWASGEYDPETNATEITGVLGWDGGDPACAHEEYEIDDEDTDDPFLELEARR